MEAFLPQRPSSTSTDNPVRERLDSWKEVACYFRREVRTVQLWEKHEGLPIRRQQHKKLGTVYAYRRELEAWQNARSTMSTAPSTSVFLTPPAPSHANSGRLSLLPMEIFWSPASGDQAKKLLEGAKQHLQASVALALQAAHATQDIALKVNLRLSDGTIHVAAQLTQTSDSSCLWTGKYTCPPEENSASHYENIAQRITRGVQAACALPLADSNPLSASRQAAHHACALGIHFWQQRNRTALGKAIGYFNDAIEIDPGCARAYAGLADCYVSMSYNHFMCPVDAMKRAGEAAGYALHLNDQAVPVRNCMSNVLLNCTWDWHGAEQHCSRSLRAEPANARTLEILSVLASSQGRHAEAISLALEAHRAEPRCPTIKAQVASAFYYAGEYGKALAYLDQSAAMTGTSIGAPALLGRIQTERGAWDEAHEALASASALSRSAPFVSALSAYLYARSGESRRAATILHTLEAQRHSPAYPAYDIAAAYTALEDKGRALQHLRQAHRQRDMKIIYMKRDPRLAGLHTDPAFREIASSMRLA